jgi:hypothetical protein
MQAKGAALHKMGHKLASHHVASGLLINLPTVLEWYGPA